METYFLNFANNLGAAAVAARENAASGQAMAALPDFVKAIALNNKLDESRELATIVQHAMIERLRGVNKTLKDLGVKQAPFVGAHRRRDAERAGRSVVHHQHRRTRSCCARRRTGSESPRRSFERRSGKYQTSLQDGRDGGQRGVAQA